MRALLKLSFLLLLLSLVALLAATWFALSDRPLVTGQVELSHQDIGRAKAILRENDPRRAPAGAKRVVEISEENERLTAENERLAAEASTASQKVGGLEKVAAIKWFLAGAAVLIIGWFLGIATGRKRKSRGYTIG